MDNKFVFIIFVFLLVCSISSHDYKFLEKNYYDSKKSKKKISTNFGIVPDNNDKENEYLSYRDDGEEGKNILISNFGEDEYECFGSCYCEKNNHENINNRESSSSSIISKRSFSYLLISLSTMMAYSKAKSYFNSKCQKELSKECHLSSIKSSVEKCSSSIVIEKQEKIISDKKDEEQQRVYFCYGSCVYNLLLKKESTIKQFSHIRCEKLKQEGEVIVYKKDLIQTQNVPSRNFGYSAKNKFQKYFLTDFCRENSMMEYTYEGIQKKLGKEYPQRKKKKGPGCVGRSSIGGNNGYKMKNVRCRQIHPEPTNLNWKWHLEKFNREKEEFDLI